LQHTLGRFQFLTVGLGAIFGVGWAVVVFGEWVSVAAPLGVVFGFLWGGTAMLFVAACYAELGTTLPRTGGDVIYA
jgi:amino acid transporter